MRVSRRDFLKLLTVGSTAIYCSGFPRRSYSKEIDANDLSLISPIDRTIPVGALNKWSGDDPSKAHGILWNKSGFISGLPEGKLPPPSEKVPLVVVGGGLSGLSTAYLLKKHSPVVLEQAPRFGGNSKGQSWNGVDYSIGAAYFIVPEEGSTIDKFVRELELHKHWKIKKDDEASTLIFGKQYDSFWDGQSDPKAKDQFTTLSKYLQAINNESDNISFRQFQLKIPNSIRT